MTEQPDTTGTLTRLWVRAWSAQAAAAALAGRPDAGNDPSLLTAAVHLGEAAGDLQRANPDRTTGAPADVEIQIAQLPIAGAKTKLAAAIRAAIRDIPDDPQVPPAQMLALGGAATSMALAHYALTGELP
jgi:hypothetical protein